jgi:hypothetical protein
MNDKRYDIIAETYLEVISRDGGWIVNLVMESPAYSKEKIVYTMAEFRKMEDADEWADAYRFLYDKSIFEYELM